MRSVALSVVLVAAAAGANAADDQPVFKVCSPHSCRAHAHGRAFTLPLRRRKSPPHSSNNSLTTGLNVGRLLRLPKRPPSAARPFPTSGNGRSRTLNHLLSLARRPSSQSPRLHTTPSLPPLHPLLTSRTSPLWSNMRCSTKRVEIAVVVTSSCSRMASRPAGRSSLTPPLG